MGVAVFGEQMFKSAGAEFDIAGYAVSTVADVSSSVIRRDGCGWGDTPEEIGCRRAGVEARGEGHHPGERPGSSLSLGSAGQMRFLHAVRGVRGVKVAALPAWRESLAEYHHGAEPLPFSIQVNDAVMESRVRMA